MAINEGLDELKCFDSSDGTYFLAWEARLKNLLEATPSVRIVGEDLFIDAVDCNERDKHELAAKDIILRAGLQIPLLMNYTTSNALWKLVHVWMRKSSSGATIRPLSEASPYIHNLVTRFFNLKRDGSWMEHFSEMRSPL
jgi:hypothetical protein